MELKRIIAQDSRAANEKAIQLYGPDVLVISCQRVDDQTELIVAVDSGAEAPAAKPPVAAAAGKSGNAVIHPAGQASGFSRMLEVAMVTKAEAARADAPAALADSPERAQASPPLPQDEEPVTDALTALRRRKVAGTVQATPAPADASASEAPTPAPAAVAPVARAPVAPAPQTLSPELAHDFLRSQETVELLRQEMAALRQEFALSRQLVAWQGGLGLSPELDSLLNRLMDLGVPASLRTLLMDSVRELDTAAEALPVIERLLGDAIARAKTAALPVKGIHALSGPSGSGKTLMTARLAHHAGLKLETEQQAIISFGDQRPGAWSQLQVLAAQTGVSCYRAKDAQALKLLLDELSDREAIWIDTAGTDFMAHAQTLAQLDAGITLHAVLPVDASVASVAKVLTPKASLWSSLMLSKMDEASHPWPLVKGLCESRLPITAVASHDQIGNPVAAFDAQTLVQLALAPLDMEPVQAVKRATRAPRARQAKAITVESPQRAATGRSRATAKVMNG